MRDCLCGWGGQEGFTAPPGGGGGGTAGPKSEGRRSKAERRPKSEIRKGNVSNRQQAISVYSLCPLFLPLNPPRDLRVNEDRGLLDLGCGAVSCPSRPKARA